MASLRVHLAFLKTAITILGMPTPSKTEERNGPQLITFELVEHGPQLSDVCGEGDVCVKDDDPLQVGGESLGQDQLHQAIDPRVMFVGDPGNLRLHRSEGEGERKKKSLH